MINCDGTNAKQTYSLNIMQRKRGNFNNQVYNYQNSIKIIILVTRARVFDLENEFLEKRPTYS